MKRLVVIIGVILTCYAGFAQGNIVFDESTHDFGEVKEEEGPIKNSFSFYNNGDQPIKILAVKASCGCTTPGWSREDVAPQDSGFVTAQYNPMNRPGRFKKSLRITYDNGSGTQTNMLYIEGMVIPRPKTIEDKLPTKVGDIRLQYRSLNLGKITTEEPVTQVFDVYNDSDTVISWQNEKAILPNHISVSYEPQTIDPKKVGKLMVTYDPNKKDDLGFVSDNIKLYTSEAEVAEKELFVITTIEEYFPQMTEEELAKAPKLSFNEVQHDFGVVTEGTVVETTFQLTNNGKEKLLIRKTKENCGCTKAKVEKSKIKSGQSIQMKVTFDTTGRRGRQYKTVTIFSNDPTAPSQMITLKAEVK